MRIKKIYLIMFLLQVQNFFKHCEIGKNFMYQKRYLRDDSDIPNDNQCLNYINKSVVKKFELSLSPRGIYHNLKQPFCKGKVEQNLLCFKRPVLWKKTPEENNKTQLVLIIQI